jgi:hypothetical protein
VISDYGVHAKVSSLTQNIVDYNSWVETDQSRKLVNGLDKNVVLAEGMPP